MLLFLNITGIESSIRCGGNCFDGLKRAGLVIYDRG